MGDYRKLSYRGKWYLVKKTPIICSTCTVYSCWEESPSGDLFRYPHSTLASIDHSTLTSIDGKPGWLGSVSSRRLPLEIDDLQGDERIEACRAYHKANYSEAYQVILAAYPEASVGGKRSMGEIRVWGEAVSFWNY